MLVANYTRNFPAAISVSIPPMVNASEGAGKVEVCATLSAVNKTERDFTISLTTIVDTGIAVSTDLNLQIKIMSENAIR